MEETVHLLSSSANAERLRHAVRLVVAADYA
jgi:PHD/YefM family antitoxin component YafN of YafNO toxin-antitoxin module